MQNFIFKTNINCSGCVAKAATVLDATKDIKNWKVDIDQPGKLLFVETDNLSTKNIISAVKKAGFTAELVK